MPAVLCIDPTAVTACTYHARLQLTGGCMPGAAYWRAKWRQASGVMQLVNKLMLAGFNGYWTDLNIEDSPRSVSKRLTARDPSLNQVGTAASPEAW